MVWHNRAIEYRLGSSFLKQSKKALDVIPLPCNRSHLDVQDLAIRMIWGSKDLSFPICKIWLTVFIPQRWEAHVFKGGKMLFYASSAYNLNILLHSFNKYLVSCNYEPNIKTKIKRNQTQFLPWNLLVPSSIRKMEKKKKDMTESSTSWVWQLIFV